VNLSIERAVTVPAAGRGTLRIPAIPIALALIAALCLPMIFASPAPLSSDESLYLAEAHSIAWGEGFTYPSGEPVTHRAPLYPLALAYAVALGGDDAAYAVSKAVVIVNMLLAMAIAWRIAGAIAGLTSGFAVSASAYLNRLGTTLYLDPFQCAFMLLSLLALLQAAREPRLRWFAAAGCCTGLAFLAKESAIQWAPLGFTAWLALPSLRNIAGARGAIVFTVAFGAIIAPWWIWVYAHTATLFLLGEPSMLTAALLVGAASAFSMFAAGVAWRCPAPAHAPIVAAWLASAAAVTLVAAWGAFMLYGLTRYSSWPYANDYAHTLPDYLTSVAPQAQPYFLLVAAWCFVAWRTVRGDDAMRLIAAGGLLFAPFALFIANRGLQLRDALPIIYLSYIALGVAVAWLITKLRASTDIAYGAQIAAAGLAVAAIALAVHQASAFREAGGETSSAEAAADWDGRFARDSAGWLAANLPGGAHLLTSRLYFSSLYVRTEGRFTIRQMPTVRVEVEPGGEGLLVPKSNLFRWGDTTVAPSADSDSWLHLRRFPGKGYWIGLRQQELLAYLVAHEIDYVVLTGDDGTFSSLHYASYFSGHPAFTLIHSAHVSAADQLFVYAVDRDALFVKEHSTAISPADAVSLRRESDMSLEAIAAALGSRVRMTDGERGLSPREEAAAIAGVDLGAP
jgi:4-amino-4-deoxy-L-arabinose transferase-like glycosyltransferase